MTTDSKKLLANHSLDLMGQVATERLKRAGVVLGKDLNVAVPKTDNKTRLPSKLVKRLAGG